MLAKRYNADNEASLTASCVPLPREMRYQVKPVIDAAAFRLAQGLTGVVLLLSRLNAHVHAWVRRCRDQGLFLILKPVKRADLLQSVDTAVAGSDPIDTRSGRATSPVHGEEEAKAAARENGESTAGWRVLVAEDHPVNQRLIVRVLEKEGHSVTVVENGTTAVEAFENKRFDVILMDVQLPKMSGTEATAAIRALERKKGGRVPIIALTANASDVDRDECFKAGMDAFVSKPFRPKKLLEVMRTSTRGQREDSSHNASFEHEQSASS